MTRGMRQAQHRPASNLSGLKTQKDTAANLLLLTDWYVTRKSETGQAVPDEITSMRSAIRAACEQREGEINDCTTVQNSPI